MILSSSIRLFASVQKQLVMALLVLIILIVLISNVHLDNVMVFGSEDHNKIGSVYQNNTKISINNLNKLIILTFGDISQTQYTNAKPILDKYGFKGSFRSEEHTSELQSPVHL